jgi:hypothetical protein
MEKPLPSQVSWIIIPHCGDEEDRDGEMVMEVVIKSVQSSPALSHAHRRTRLSSIEKIRVHDEEIALVMTDGERNEVYRGVSVVHPKLVITKTRMRENHFC